MTISVRYFLFGFLMLALTACESAYYSTMERLGVPKRDILVDRIGDAQQAQEEGQEQFRSALEQFQSVVNFDGGDLQQVYNRMNREYEASQRAAERIRTRIASVESVADALFSEWNAELRQYNNQELRRESERQLRETRERYARVIDAMHRAEGTLEPVLSSLNDNVLYLRHNLNAQAIASLRGELDSINTDVERLIEAMQQAISESDEFIRQMRQPG